MFRPVRFCDDPHGLLGRTGADVKIIGECFSEFAIDAPRRFFLQRRIEQPEIALYDRDAIRMGERVKPSGESRQGADDAERKISGQPRTGIEHRRAVKSR